MRVKLDKKDLYRALLTDTAPGDVPVIFSNDGLYGLIMKRNPTGSAGGFDIIESIFKNLIDPSDASTQPYKYSIKKDLLSLRTLSLLHPANQTAVCDFYTTHAEKILYFCRRSPASIRAPFKISNSYYAVDVDKANKYKEDDIDTTSNELLRRHSSSYFSYRGYPRMYKFFESPRYLGLEKRFSTMWMLDVSNCFDSIYTHTVGWSVKNKEFSKKTVNYKNQFSSKFDILMQRSNSNETNGIAIGAEISRIFSEIIFQDVDCLVVNDLINNHGFVYGKDYEFVRYVDDFVLFAKSDIDAEVVGKSISDALYEYKLFVNDNKINKYKRPFNTKKSTLVTVVKDEILKLEKSLYEISESGLWMPVYIKSRLAIEKNFINRIKLACDQAQSSYQDISAYLISTFTNRVIRLTEFEYTDLANEASDLPTRLWDLLILLVDLIFYFYTVSPQVQSSYKVAKTVIILDRFFCNSLDRFSDNYRTKIMEHISQVSIGEVFEKRSRYVSLEWMNILLATSEFGDNYFVPCEILEKLVDESPNLSYFEIISLLYYLKDGVNYKLIRDKLSLKIASLFCGDRKIKTDSEMVHMTLDFLSCKYLEKDLRAKIFRFYMDEFELAVTLTSAETDTCLENLLQSYWFVQWVDLNLVKLLERKELLATY